MPAEKEGASQIGIRVSPELLARLKRVAAGNRRSMRGELLRLIEGHVEREEKRQRAREAQGAE